MRSSLPSPREVGRAEDRRGGEPGEVSVRSLGDGARRDRKVAGGGRAGAGGRARPGGPHPGVPARAAIEEEEKDDLQIHSEGGATDLGAVSGVLNHPSRGQGRRGGARALWGPFVTSASLLSFHRREKKKLSSEFSPSSFAELCPFHLQLQLRETHLCYPRAWPSWAALPELRSP